MNQEQKERNARDLLSNPLFQELSNEISQDYYQQWLAAPDAPTRETIWNRSIGLREVVGRIRMACEKGGGGE